MANSATNYSGGGTHKVTVSAKNNPNSQYSGREGCTWPYVWFTFTGTGFDVISVSSNTTGLVNVQIYEGATIEGTSYKSFIVDTYNYNDDIIYQAPAISKLDLPYNTYTVKITPTYTSLFDHAKRGSFDFYVDAIKIYNPNGVK